MDLYVTRFTFTFGIDVKKWVFVLACEISGGISESKWQLHGNYLATAEHKKMVELGGFEPPTFWLPVKRSPNWTTAP